jgi:hypothetical protein
MRVYSNTVLFWIAVVHTVGCASSFAGGFYPIFGIINPTDKIATHGIIFHFDATRAQNKNAVFANGCSNTSRIWKDLGSTSFDGTLNNFGLNAACSNGYSGWNGLGTWSSPFALAFDGLGDYVSANTVTWTVGSMTAEAWFNTTSTNTTAAILNISNDTSPLMIVNGKLGYVFTGVGGGVQSGGPTVADGNWHHAVLVSSGTNVNVYLDGNATPVAGLTTTTGANGSVISGPGALMIGYDSVGSYSYYAGSVGIARMYSRALSVADIQKNYKAQKQRFATATSSSISYNFNTLLSTLSPTGYWRLGESSGSTLTDSSGNAYNGTYNGSVTLGITGALTNDSNTAVSLPGVATAYLEMPGTSLNMASGSVAFWMKSTSTNNTGGNGLNTVGNALLLGRHDTMSGFTFYTNNAGALALSIKDGAGGGMGVTTSVGPYNNGLWHFIVLNFSQSNGASNSLYIDGALVGSITNSMAWSFSNTVVRVSRSLDPYWANYNGQIDEIATFSTQLTPPQITNLYNAGGIIKSNIVTEGLVLDLDAAQASSSMAPYPAGCAGGNLNWYDLTNNALNGVLTNMSSCDATIGWNGIGTTASPYNLTFKRISASYVSLPSMNPDFTSGLTAEAWVYPTLSSAWERFFDFGNGQASNNIILGRYDITGNVGFSTYVGGSGMNAASTGAMTNSTWQHIVAVLSNHVGANGTVQFYINGVAAGSGTTLWPTNLIRTNNYIGKSNWTDPGYTAYYSGGIGAIRLYNTPLSAAQVLQNCRADQGRFGGAICHSVPALTAPASDYYTIGSSGNSPFYTSNGTAYAINIPVSNLEGFTLTNSCTYSTLGLSSSDPNYVSSASPAACTTLPSMVTGANGVLYKGTVTAAPAGPTNNYTLTWQPTSTQRGTYKFNVSSTDGTVSSGTSSFYITVGENLTTTNAVQSLDSLLSDGTAAISTSKPSIPHLTANSNNNKTAAWIDLTSNSNGSLSLLGSTAPWGGTGQASSTAVDPYALSLNGTSDTLDLGSQLNNKTQFALETWVKPTTPSSAGRVIAGTTSSGGASTTGFSLRQSSLPTGRVELAVGQKYYSYRDLILSDNPSGGYWRLDETSGTTAVDSSAAGNTGTYYGAVTLNQTAALVSDDSNAGTSVSINGHGQYATVSTTNAVVNPQTFSIEIWMKTTTVYGGRIIGFGDAQSGTNSNSTSYDRAIYMDNAGKLYFVICSTALANCASNTGDIITTTSSYNDGNWHHLLGTFTANSLVLYVDGAQVGTITTNVPAAQAYTGYWKIGGDTLNGVLGGPTDWNITASLDEAAIYYSILSPTQVLNHYNTGKFGKFNSYPKNTVLADNPVGYWRLGETSGTTANDLSGNNNNGTYTGGYTLAQTGALPGDTDSSVLFNGSSGSVGVPDSNNYNFTTGMSAEGWFYANSWNTYGSIIDRRNPSNGNGGFDFEPMDTSGNLSWRVNINGAWYANNTTGWSTGQWYHVVLTYTGSAIQTYRNGVLLGSSAVSGTLTSAAGLTTHIGKNSGPIFFNGKLDEVALYNYALSPTQVFNHYNSGKFGKFNSYPGNAVLADNPIGYWRPPVQRQMTSLGIIMAALILGELPLLKQERLPVIPIHPYF